MTEQGRGRFAGEAPGEPDAARTFRPASARPLAVGVIAACLLGLGSLVFGGDGALLVRASAPIVLIAVAAWTLLWVPAVLVDETEVVLLNPLRTIRLPWRVITDVRTRWGLDLLVDRRRYGAWAATRPGSVEAARAARRKDRLAASRTPSGGAERRPAMAVAAVVEQRWHAEHSKSGGATAAVRWHRGTVLVLAVLVVTSAAGALVH